MFRHDNGKVVDDGPTEAAGRGRKPQDPCQPGPRPDHLYVLPKFQQPLQNHNNNPSCRQFNKNIAGKKRPLNKVKVSPNYSQPL